MLGNSIFDILTYIVTTLKKMSQLPCSEEEEQALFETIEYIESIIPQIERLAV